MIPAASHLADTILARTHGHLGTAFLSLPASSQSDNLPQCVTWQFLLLCEFEVHCVGAYPLIQTPSFTGQGQYSCPFRHNLFYRKFPRGLNVSSLVVRIYLVN
jgi:hypothetical protein